MNDVINNRVANLTSLVLAAFVAYIAAWYLGWVEGNFALMLFLATVVTGVYWVAEHLYFLPQRKRSLEVAEAQATKRLADLQAQGITQVDAALTDDTRHKLLMQPWWLDWTAGLFPVIAVVFVLRSFLFEPFKIPSGSMIPTLRVGDLILVNKFHYGVRLPVINTKIIDNHQPQRGDVMVFRYPPQPSLDYIKRVVGVPGDEVAYLNKVLTINGVPVPKSRYPIFSSPMPCVMASSFRKSRMEEPMALSMTMNAQLLCPVPAISCTKTIAATPWKVWFAKCRMATIF